MKRKCLKSYFIRDSQVGFVLKKALVSAAEKLTYCLVALKKHVGNPHL